MVYIQELNVRQEHESDALKSIVNLELMLIDNHHEPRTRNQTTNQSVNQPTDHSHFINTPSPYTSINDQSSIFFVFQIYGAPQSSIQLHTHHSNCKLEILLLPKSPLCYQYKFNNRISARWRSETLSTSSFGQPRTPCTSCSGALLQFCSQFPHKSVINGHNIHKS